MKKFIALVIFTTAIGFLQAQDYQSSQFDFVENDSIYMKCLNQTKHFISINALQYLVGTANIAYEYSFTPQIALRVAVGTLLGYRMLNDKFLKTQYETPKFGGLYCAIEPRVFMPQAKENCWFHWGFSASYKYWRYTTVEYTDNENNPDQQTEYKENVWHRIGTVSILAKHPITGGFTFEYQAGIGAGVKNKEFYSTPNLEFSMGYIF
ncbi:MAG: hypothetical protein LBR55_01835 [Bacteroidales bacterium]|nr:hypothetical protein [Bacteroidales bacterium]